MDDNMMMVLPGVAQTPAPIPLAELLTEQPD